jgi:hypothetical protein
MDMNVRVKCLRGFTEFVKGRGMVVFSAARDANKAVGFAGREATEDDLPEDIAAERERRGFVEILGEGSTGEKKSPAQRRSERRLAEREARRAGVTTPVADGFVIGGAAEGEDHTPNLDDERALRERQDNIGRGERDDGGRIATADGPGTQAASLAGSVRAADEGQGVTNTDTDGRGDGANSVFRPPVITAQSFGGAETTEDAGEPKPAKAKRTRAPRASRAKATTTKASSSKRTSRAKGGTTANPTDAPAE